MHKMSRNFVFEQSTTSQSEWKIFSRVPCPIPSTKCWLSSSKSARASPVTMDANLSFEKNNSTFKFIKKEYIQEKFSALKSFNPCLSSKSEKNEQLCNTDKVDHTALSAVDVSDQEIPAAPNEAKKLIGFETLRKNAAFIRVNRLISDVQLSFKVLDVHDEDSQFLCGALRDQFQFGVFTGFVQLGVRSIEIRDMFGWMVNRQATW